MQQVSPEAIGLRSCAPAHASRLRQRGFTLIELLVVIAILGVLAAVLLPNIISSKETANIFADKANLGWHYKEISNFRARLKRFPREGGHRFVLSTWVEGILEKTPENRDRFFNPATWENDVRLGELRQEDPKSIWKRYDDLSSNDTTYAGRGKKHLSGNIESGEEAWMADDNEYGPAFKSGTINVLMGSGSVRELTIEDLKKHGYREDEEGYVFAVGPDSPMPLLQKLDK